MLGYFQTKIWPQLALWQFFVVDVEKEVAKFREALEDASRCLKVDYVAENLHAVSTFLGNDF